MKVPKGQLALVSHGQIAISPQGLIACGIGAHAEALILQAMGPCAEMAVWPHENNSNQ